MCLCCRKLIEWFAMIAAVLYAVTCLIYVLLMLALAITVSLAVRTEFLSDFGILLLALLTAVLLYTQSIALLTATERLVSIMEFLT